MISKALKNNIGIHHIVFTVVDILETEKFYSKIFGAPDRADGAKILYTVGPTLLIFMQKSVPNPLSTKFDPTVIGLEHFAIGLKNLDELQQVEKVLTESQIANSGIHIDSDSGREKIWLNDPSNIRVEFFL
jgi:catechol-2,3-dioxygenase